MSSRSDRRAVIGRVLVSGAIVLAAWAIFSYPTASSGASKKPPPVIKVAMVVKVQGSTLFGANQQGAEDVANAPGSGIKLDFTAPATFSALAQVAIINSLITQDKNVIVLSAVDPTELDAVLEKAMKHGIKVVTFDSDVNPAARDFFIQDTPNNTIAQSVLDAAVKFAGTKTQVALMASTPGTTVEAAWISAIKAYAASKYPDLKFVTIGYGDSSLSTSLNVAESIIHSYPKVRAILSLDTAAVEGAAQAVTALGDAGKVGVFGVGDPLPNRTYFADGSLQALFLWNEVDEGKLTMYVAKLAYENKLKAGGTFSTPLGTFTVAAHPDPLTGATKDTIVFSEPLEFTKSNYGQYPY